MENEAGSTVTEKPARRRWLRVILITGVILIGAALLLIEFQYRRPEGSGPAGPPVDIQAFESEWSKHKFLLLGIGDSVTAGLGADSAEHSYFMRLLENPSDEFPEMQGRCLRKVLPNLEHQNVAISGSTSLQHAEVIEELEVQAENVFGIVVITTGGNDLIHNYGRSAPREGAMYGATLEQAEDWIGNFETRLTGMLDNITKKFPGGSEIFLGDIYDPTDGIGDAPSVFLPDWPDGLKIHSRYNEIIHRVCSEYENVHCVAIHELFLGHGSHCRQFWRTHYDARDPHYWYYVNIEDPNDRGYDALRRVFLNEIVTHRERLTGVGE